MIVMSVPKYAPLVERDLYRDDNVFMTPTMVGIFWTLFMRSIA